MEDVGRAGGVYSILGALQRAERIHTGARTIHAKTIGEAIAADDIRSETADPEAMTRALAAPGGVRTTLAFSQDKYYESADLDGENGCIREAKHAYSTDGGLAVLYGNIADDGCIVKTAGVDESVLVFEGPARVFESQDASCQAIIQGEIKEGDVLVIRYEGPKGGPGMQEMLYPTSYLKSKKLGKACALVTDGRFSGGSSGLSIGHVSPEAAEGGAIALIQEGDLIRIDIRNRKIDLAIDESELQARRSAMEKRGHDAWQPETKRERAVSGALRAYALLTTSASRGAVRDPDQITGKR
jgi:dihydroxy-acid dehydratase